MFHAREIPGICGSELGRHRPTDSVIKPGLRHEVAPVEVSLVIIRPAVLSLVLVGRAGFQHVVSEIDRHESGGSVIKAVRQLGVKIHERIAESDLLVIV